MYFCSEVQEFEDVVMFQHCKKAFPLVPRLLIQRQHQQSLPRYIWNFGRPVDLRSIVRDMDRAAERFEREVADFFPFRRHFFPRPIAIEGVKQRGDAYHLNFDVQGFKPEEINVSLKDNVLKIQAKMERTGEDGSKYQQEFSRELTLPENVDPAELKSYLHDGILSIEATYKPEEKPKEIPVSKD